MRLLKNTTVLPLTCILILFFAGNAFSQGYGDRWVIGTPNVLVSFDTTYHFDYFDISPNYCSREMVSETDDICDLRGKIQFYYNGMNIISFKKYGVMDNGDSLDCCLNEEIYLCGSAAYNASVIIPSSVDSNRYFVYQTNIDTSIMQDTNDIVICSKLLRHTVDMSQNNGEGFVTNKNDVLFRAHYLLTRLAAVRHANGRDWWLVGHGYNGIYGSNLFYIWLIKNDSLQPPILQQTGSFIYWEAYGKTTFSPDGSLMAMVTADDTLNIFDFDRCAGILSNARKEYIYDTLPVAASDFWLNSCAFSADSRFLYTNGDDGKIRQFDMTVSNLDSSMEIIGEFNEHIKCYYDSSGTNGMGDMQLAPDGRIYISPYQAQVCLHVINYPEIKGINCDFVQDAIQLYPNVIPMSGGCLPNMPNYKLGPLIGSVCDTINGIANVELKNIKVYPNPANELVNIEVVGGATPDEINIIDVTGRVWQQMKPNKPNTQINISNLPQGVYFVQVKMATRVMVSKVVKQ